MIAFAVIILSFWFIILSSFIVGMAINVRLGGLVLGYGLAGIIGIALMGLIATFVLVYIFV